MSIDRRSLLIAGTAAALVQPETGFAETQKSSVEVGDNGLHIQDWFLESFLDLGEDYSAAADAGKGLIVLFEQRGCPYCGELHNVNLAQADIRSYMQKKFDTVQLDIFGSREVTDFDGKAMEERRLASRWGVNFTPTAVFFSGATDGILGKMGRDAEAARMPGYFKPYHFLSMLEFVGEGHYKTTQFQRYISNKINAQRAKGEKPSVW